MNKLKPTHDSNSLSYPQNDELQPSLPPPSPYDRVCDTVTNAAVGGDEVVAEDGGGEEDEEEEGGEEGGGGEDDDVEEGDDVEDEDEGVEVVADDAAAATSTAEHLKRQKLAEGFYEVEAIRKKRICKGEPQYLIKWRGWPESANTWEPVDHLQTCPDVVESYEESLQSGQKKISRKRRRKFTQPKKKMQYSYGVSKSKIAPIKESLSSEPQGPSGLKSSKDAKPQSGIIDSFIEHEETTKRSRTTRRFDCNGSETMSHVSSSEKVDDGKLFDQITSGRNLDPHQQSMHVEGDGPANCLSKDASQSNPRRGAKRRKSGSVRRFTQDVASFSVDCYGTSSPTNVSSCKKVEELMIENSVGCRKNKYENTRSSAVITRLIRPVSYSASVTNNIQDVSVTFVAMRSDGKETMVDNKYLKANNPLLLINYYEQNLRYNPN